MAAADARLQLIGTKGLLPETDLTANQENLELSLDIANTPYVRAQTNPIYLP